MKTILISHVDMDGISPGILAEHFGLPFDKIVYWDYGFEEDKKYSDLLQQYDTIIMVDLSCSQKFYESLIASGKQVEIYDHHVNEDTAWIVSVPNCIQDGNRSGTKIFFEEYLSKIVPRTRPIVREFVELVHTYDTWQTDSPLWKEACNLQRVVYKYACWGIPDIRTQYDRFFTAAQRKFDNQDHWSWNSTELRYIEESLSRENEVYQTAIRQLQFRTDSKGKTFGVFKAGGKISFVADRLLREDGLPVEYLLVVNDYKGVNGKMSGRSLKGKFDCTQLGLLSGHKDAAGGTLETPTMAQEFWDHDYSLKYKDEMTEEDKEFVWKKSLRSR